jgi:dCMP deaminase
MSTKIVKDIIIESLSKLGFVISTYQSPVLDDQLLQIYNQKQFTHDILVNNKLFIQYNDCFNKYTEENHLFEIRKAHNCINASKGYSYLLLWDNDLSLSEMLDLICHTITSQQQTFYSSRQMDYELYHNIDKEAVKLKNENMLFSDIVKRYSNESKCLKKKVAAIATRNGRIIATGINGTPKNYTNCIDYFKTLHKTESISIPFDEWINTEEWSTIHREWSSKHEIHAEVSLISEAARSGIRLEGCDIYVSLEPCFDCIKALSALGIKRVFYTQEHKPAVEKRNLLNACKVIIKKI